MPVFKEEGPLPDGHPFKGTHVYFRMKPPNLTRKNSEMKEDTMEAKMRERFEARGIEVRSMTPEEAATIPIFLHFRSMSIRSKQNTPQRPEDEMNNDPLTNDVKESVRRAHEQQKSQHESSKK